MRAGGVARERDRVELQRIRARCVRLCGVWTFTYSHKRRTMPRSPPPPARGPPALRPPPRAPHAHARVARHRRRAARGTCAIPPAAPRQRAHSVQRDIARPAGQRRVCVCARAGAPATSHQCAVRRAFHLDPKSLVTNDANLLLPLPYSVEFLCPIGDRSTTDTWCAAPTRLRRETPVSSPAYSQVSARRYLASSWLPTWWPGGWEAQI